MGLHIGGGYVAHLILPWPTGLELARLGVGIVIASLLIDMWVFELFKRHRTTIRPDRGASALVTEGPFRFSRNPVYVGNVLIMLGFIGIGGSWWFGVMALSFAYWVDRLAIRAEETHMAAMFGEAWTSYAARVRRWL